MVTSRSLLLGGHNRLGFAESLEITGGSVSATVTLNSQDARSSNAFVAEHATVVVPTGKTEPEGGSDTSEAPSEVVTVYCTRAEHCPGSVEMSMSWGHTIVGAGQTT